ncbi:MAG: GntR family transcriptional regulator [Clostridia bacterium]|nr:GntR family transcriptional regulator [Clostridia bacterium]
MAWQFSGRQDVYIEIAEKITQYIRAGVYRAGDKLPSVRQAAGEMGVNPNTVARAYALLEERGLVHSLPKKGAYVAEGSTPSAEQGTETARAALLALKARGIGYDELIALAKEVFLHD